VKCGAWKGQLGLEFDWSMYVEHLVELFREVKRVLKKTGSLWLNIGDTYSDKCLLGIPWRVAFALMEDGWILRNAIIWYKPSHMPESTKDRLTRTYEYVFHFVKSKKYYYNLDLIREPYKAGDSIEEILRYWGADKHGEYHGKAVKDYESAKAQNAAEVKRRIIENLKSKYLTMANIETASPAERSIKMSEKLAPQVKQKILAIGEYLKNKLRESGYTIKQLAEITGIKQTTLEHYFRADFSGQMLPNREDWSLLKPLLNLGEYDEFVDEEIRQVLPQPHPIGRNPGDLWSINPKPFKEAHFACVDEKTECLTVDGWKTYKELREGDLIVTFNTSSEMLELQPVRKVYIYDYDGDIIRVESRDLSLALTPNHRCLVLRRTKNGYRKEIVPAEHLNSRMKILTGSNGIKEQPSIFTDDEVELFGWILTEGSYDSYKVAIYQNDGEKATKIEDCLRRNGVNYSIYRRSGTRSRQLAFCIKSADSKRLKLLLPNKRMPIRYLFQMSRAQLRLLLDILVDGDGHRRKDGRICIVQKDKYRVDLFQILAILLGFRANISERKNGVKTIWITNHKFTGLRKTNGKGTNIFKEHYRGKVWCPNVENGTFVARRNGKVFITGNTFPPELPLRPILASCPPDGVVLDPLAGSGTVAYVCELINRGKWDKFRIHVNEIAKRIKWNLKWIMIEINPKYCKIMEKRLEPFMKQKSLDCFQVE
jgi:DNA modification methylase